MMTAITESGDRIAIDNLGLPEALQRGCAELGYSHCTPIQAMALPIALQGRDVVGQAQTGTGKTAAFLLATYHHLLRHEARGRPRAIILAPTRELAIQIHKDAEALGRYSGLRLGLVYGGEGYDSQRKQLEEGVDILIGTPGRLIDYFKQHLFDLRAIQVMVLDEADRMFDLGFIKDIRFLLRRMPKPEQRLNMLFSATLSFRVMELSYEHMNNPQRVVVDAERVTADKVQEAIYFPGMADKIPLLLGLLRGQELTRTLVFVNTKRVGAKLEAYLKGNGHEAAVLSGDVPQNKRIRLLENFSKGELPILIATDVAARGLHIPEVSHVINYDLPQDPEDYVHRIGRTARAGASGDAISFACEEFSFSLMDIEAYIGHKIPVKTIDPALLVEPQPPVKEAKRPVGAHRRDQGNGRRNKRPRRRRG